MLLSEVAESADHNRSLFMGDGGGSPASFAVALGSNADRGVHLICWSFRLTATAVFINLSKWAAVSSKESPWIGTEKQRLTSSSFTDSFVPHGSVAGVEK